MRKLGLELALDSGQPMLLQPTLGRLRFAPMAIMDIPRTPARLMATMGLIILSGARLLAQVRGFMASTAEATTVVGAAIIIAAGMETMTDSAVASDFVAKMDGMKGVDSEAKENGTAIMDYVDTETSTAVATSTAAGSAAVTGFMAAGTGNR